MKTDSDLKRRRLLLVAFHFPPIQGSTGTNRTLAFSRYLREYGWDVHILTIHPRAYEYTSDENLSLIPGHIEVSRAWGLNARLHMSIYGRYPRVFALPDRWVSWAAGGYFTGRRILNSWKPDVIMSTYPIATAHIVAYLLSRQSNLPWIAEFRDPMLQETYPTDRLERWAFSKVESLVIKQASNLIVTTESCRETYTKRFPRLDENRISVISNGFDPELFPNQKIAHDKVDTDGFVLLHSGLLYPHERNPHQFFLALEELKHKGFFSELGVEFRFRASGNDIEYCRIVTELGIGDIVTFLPRVSYEKAIEEMLFADALMIFQADNCNSQIPAKVYEYFYAEKPILAFADPIGDTAQLLSEVGVTSIAKLESKEDIVAGIEQFISALTRGKAFVVPDRVVSRFSRKSLTRDLSDVLNSVALTGVQ